MNLDNAESVIAAISAFERNPADARAQVALEIAQSQCPGILLRDGRGRVSRDAKRLRERLKCWVREGGNLDRTCSRSTQFIDGVLVIGSCHLDVYCDYPADQEQITDRRGAFSYGVGGTAFNIAANLAQHGIPTALHTYLRKQSRITAVLVGRIEAAGIHQGYVRFQSDLRESAFVGLRSGGDLKVAVSCMAIEEAAWDPMAVGEAVQAARVVVVDCNLSESQLVQVTGIVRDQGKPCLCAGVSEPKVRRILALEESPGPLFAGVFMNWIEAESLFGKGWQTRSHGDLVKVANTERLFVTDGPRGYRMVTAKGARDFAAPAASVSSTSGAGDALGAAIAASLYRFGAIRESDFEPIVTEYITRVITGNGPTPGSAIVTELVSDEIIREVISEGPRATPWIRFLRSAWGTALTVLTLLSLAAMFFSTEFAVLVQTVRGWLAPLIGWLGR